VGADRDSLVAADRWQARVMATGRTRHGVIPRPAMQRRRARCRHDRRPAIVGRRPPRL